MNEQANSAATDANPVAGGQNARTGLTVNSGSAVLEAPTPLRRAAARLRVMFVVPYPTEAPSNRLRIEQYFPYLRRHGISTRRRAFMSSSFFRVRYRRGALLQKAALLTLSMVNRLLDIRRSGEYDVIVVHREAFPFGGPFVERLMARSGTPIVFDFDDAIYLPSAGGARWPTSMLRRPEKTGAIIKLSSAVIAGNETLRQYASAFSDDITVIPTPVDTEHFKPRRADRDPSLLTIGWIGSNTTAPYLQMVEPALEALMRRYPSLELRIVGGSYRPEGLERVSPRRWGLESELREMHDFDIGIMPMPDDAWTRGKCGFKTLLYMSVGLPSVSSPVGVTRDIIQDGQNGYLAATTDEWIERLSRLLDDAELRRKLGLAGRATCEEKFSLTTQAPRLLQVLEKAANQKPG